MSQWSINEITTFRWTFEEDVQHYAAMGIPAIGIWRHKISDFGEEKGLELLAESGLEVSSLMWAGGFTGGDGRSFHECLADAREAIRQAASLRAACLIVYTGPRAGHTRNHCRRLTVTALRKLLPVAEEHNVVLAIEPMHPGCADQWTYLTELDEARQLVQRLDSPHVKMVLDTYHLGHDLSLTSRLEAMVPEIGLVQLGDARSAPRGEQNRCPLGDGSVPLEEIVQTLLESSYEGYFEVELIGEDTEQFTYRQLLDHSSAGCQQLLAAAEPRP